MKKSIEEINGLAWYAEGMNRALQKMTSFKAPANSTDMRFYYSLFVVDLLSLLERSKELFGDSVETDWALKLEGLGGHSGANNAGYVRELRNAVVHRGLDLTTSGTSRDGWVFAIGPETIEDRLGKKSFRRPTFTLVETFKHCRQAVGPLILQFAASALADAESRTVQDLKAEYLRSLEDTSHMPEEIKQLSRLSVDQIPFHDMVGKPHRLRLLLA